MQNPVGMQGSLAGINHNTLFLLSVDNIYLFIYLFVCLFVVCLFICLFVCLFIY